MESQLAHYLSWRKYFKFYYFTLLVDKGIMLEILFFKKVCGSGTYKITFAIVSENLWGVE
jgi:hypothetical protein